MRIKWANIVVVLAVLVVVGWGARTYIFKPNPSNLEPPARPLRVGVVTWPGYAGGIVANNGFKPNKDSIYYKDHNFEVEFMLMEDADARSKAFSSGSVDIVWSTVDFWANELPGFLKSGVKARAIMQVDWSRGGDAIVADNSVQKIEDLRGRKVSLALLTPSQWLLEYSIRNSSLTPDEQTQIVKNLVGKNASPDARDDFVSRKVDAAVVWEPDVTDAVQKRPNSHVLLSSKTAANLIADLMVVREDFISKHPDIVKGFVEGWFEGTERANRDPDLVVKLLMENEPVYKDLGAASTKAQLTSVHWATLSDNTEMFDLDGKDKRNGNEPLFDRIFKAASQAWVQRGIIKESVLPDVAKEPRFLKAVERVEAGIPSMPENLCAGTGVLTKPVTINFASGKSELDGSAKEIIKTEVALLPKTQAGAWVCLEGNTDITGSRELNIALSAARAESVRKELLQLGLKEGQFKALGHGPDNPVCSEKTQDCFARNRRTDIKVIPFDRPKSGASS